MAGKLKELLAAFGACALGILVYGGAVPLLWICLGMAIGIFAGVGAAAAVMQSAHNTKNNDDIREKLNVTTHDMRRKNWQGAAWIRLHETKGLVEGGVLLEDRFPPRNARESRVEISHGFLHVNDTSRPRERVKVPISSLRLRILEHPWGELFKWTRRTPLVIEIETILHDFNVLGFARSSERVIIMELFLPSGYHKETLSATLVSNGARGEWSTKNIYKLKSAYLDHMKETAPVFKVIAETERRSESPVSGNGETQEPESGARQRQNVNHTTGETETLDSIVDSRICDPWEETTEMAEITQSKKKMKKRMSPKKDKDLIASADFLAADTWEEMLARERAEIELKEVSKERSLLEYSGRSSPTTPYDDVEEVEGSSSPSPPERNHPATSSTAGIDGDLRWFNAIGNRIWFDYHISGKINQYVETRVKDSLKRLETPNWMGSLKMVKLDIGGNPPVLLWAKHSETATDNTRAMMNIRYNGQIRIVLETNIDISTATESLRRNGKDTEEGEEAIIGADAVEDSDAIESPRNSRQTVVGSIASRVVQIASRVAQKVSNVSLQLVLLCTEVSGTIQLDIAPPPSNRLWWGFTHPPNIIAHATPLIANRRLGHQGLSSRLSNWIIQRLKSEIDDFYVLPNRQDAVIPHLMDLFSIPTNLCDLTYKEADFPELATVPKTISPKSHPSSATKSTHEGADDVSRKVNRSLSESFVEASTQVKERAVSSGELEKKSMDNNNAEGRARLRALSVPDNPEVLMEERWGGGASVATSPTQVEEIQEGDSNQNFSPDGVPATQEPPNQSRGLLSSLQSKVKSKGQGLVEVIDSRTKGSKTRAFIGKVALLRRKGGTRSIESKDST